MQDFFFYLWTMRDNQGFSLFRPILKTYYMGLITGIIALVCGLVIGTVITILFVIILKRRNKDSGKAITFIMALLVFVISTLAAILSIFYLLANFVVQFIYS